MSIYNTKTIWIASIISCTPMDVPNFIPKPQNQKNLGKRMSKFPTLNYPQKEKKGKLE